MSKGYPQTTGELRESLLAELETLRRGSSTVERAKEVVRIANSANELLRTELSIKKFEIEIKEAVEFGGVRIGKPD